MPTLAIDGAISGAFEYVNEHHIALTLSIPKKYENARFPAVTLISPMRALHVNWLRLRINGRVGRRLENEKILIEKPDPAPHLQISGWRYLGRAHDGRVLGLIEGQLLDEVKEVRLNGCPCDREPFNAGNLQTTCLDSPEVEWTLTAMTEPGDKAKNKIARYSAPNPFILALTSFRYVENGIRYDGENKPVKVPVRLTGSGFTPRVQLGATVDRSRVLLSYISPTELSCEVTNPRENELIEITFPGEKQQTASIYIPRPPDWKQPDKTHTSKTVTTIQTQKEVTKE
jgi:hypothetical protein